MEPRRPANLMEGFNNRKQRAASMRGRDQTADLTRAVHDLKAKVVELQSSLAKSEKEKQELEQQLKKSDKENKRLVDKIAECLEEKQDLEEALHRKDDILKTKPKGKFSGFVVSMQDKLKNRPSIEIVKQTKYYKNEPCFDTDLDKVIMHETITHVPKVIVECVKLLESKPTYMQFLGLYRASGNHADIQKLRFKIDANNYKSLHEQTDPHNITGIVKLFFRELKAPLVSLCQIETAIPDSQFFLNMDVKLQIADVQNLVKQLPVINKATLKFFIEHIARVAAVRENQMTAYTLSIVIGACLFYETMQTTNVYLMPNRCAEIMIEHHTDVFK